MKIGQNKKLWLCLYKFPSLLRPSWFEWDTIQEILNVPVFNQYCKKGKKYN